MEPSRNYVRRCLVQADETLKDAEMLLSHDRLRSAADRAYYAVYHAAQALLYSKGLKPKTHSGLQRMFDEHVVKTGLISEELGVTLADAFKLRQKSDYDVEAVITKELVDDIIKRARQFVSKIKGLLT